MDLEKLIGEGELPFSNCIASKSSPLLGFDVRNHCIEVDRHARFDEVESTYLFPIFSIDVGDASYVGGEVAAHGSGGFFYKKTKGVVEWVLMATESNPFVGVVVHPACARFLTSSGVVWVVPDDNIQMTFIEKDASSATRRKGTRLD